MPPFDRHLAEPTGKDQVQVGIGASAEPDAFVAGRVAAASAVAGLAGEPVAMVLVYGSVTYDLSALLAGVREVTGSAPLAGSTSSGQFHSGTVIPPGVGVSVLALAAGPYRFGVAAMTGVAADRVASGQKLARAARSAAGPQAGPHAALLLFADGLVGNQQELVSGLHMVTGAVVPMVGGVAADDRRRGQASLFCGGQVLTDAAVAVWIGSPWRLPISVGHGWHPVGLPLLVTGVDGTVIHEIAGRPAAEVVREHFQRVELDRPGWSDRPGRHPAQALGLIEPDGGQVIRSIYLDGDGSVRTLCPLPPYSPIQIVACQPEGMLAAVRRVAAEVTAEREPSVLLGFSCVARLDLLYERWGDEAAALDAAASGAATFGYYTYGEFARTSGVAGYHNATLAVMAL